VLGKKHFSLRMGLLSLFLRRWYSLIY